MTTDGTFARHSALLAPLGLALLCLSRPAAAALPPLPLGDPFAGVAPVDHAELSQMRGGMMIGGIPVNFAVTITTTVQGANQPPVGLQTTLTVNDAGGIGTSTTSSLGLPHVVADAGGLTLMLSGNATSIIQQVTRNQVQTLIANAANGLSVTHATDIQVTLPHFLATNRAFTSQAQAAHLGLESSLAGILR